MGTSELSKEIAAAEVELARAKQVYESARQRVQELREKADNFIMGEFERNTSGPGRVQDDRDRVY